MRQRLVYQAGRDCLDWIQALPHFLAAVLHVTHVLFVTFAITVLLA